MCLRDGGLSVSNHKISRFVSTHSETYYSYIGISLVSLIADAYACIYCVFIFLPSLLTLHRNVPRTP